VCCCVCVWVLTEQQWVGRLAWTFHYMLQCSVSPHPGCHISQWVSIGWNRFITVPARYSYLQLKYPISLKLRINFLFLSFLEYNSAFHLHKLHQICQFLLEILLHYSTKALASSQTCLGDTGYTRFGTAKTISCLSSPCCFSESVES